MLARFVWEIHAWAIPLTWLTGCVMGYAYFRNSLFRKHPDLYAEWYRRGQPEGAEPGEEEQDDS
jgi:hypothetical protein